MQCTGMTTCNIRGTFFSTNLETLSSHGENKISKFAACTLANLATVPSIMTMITPYEQELFLAACTDDSISKILLGIISL